MNCTETKKNITAFLDGEMNPDQGQEIQQHLSECESCRMESESDREAKALFQKVAIQYRAPANLRKRIRKAIAAENRQSGYLSIFISEPRAIAAAILTILIAAFVGIQVYKYMMPQTQFGVSYVEDLKANIQCIGCYYEVSQNAEKYCQQYGHSPAIMTDNMEVYSFIPNVKSTELVEHLEAEVKINGWVFYQSNFIEVEDYELIDSTVASIDNLQFASNQFLY